MGYDELGIGSGLGLALRLMTSGNEGYTLEREWEGTGGKMKKVRGQRGKGKTQTRSDQIGGAS